MENSHRKTSISGTKIAVVLLLAGIAAIVFGIFRGEATIVLKKATMICLECIGLG